jgi:hypothetical protein
LSLNLTSSGLSSVYESLPGVKLSTHRVGLPGNVDMIIMSAFLPAHKAGDPADLPVSIDGSGVKTKKE